MEQSFNANLVRLKVADSTGAAYIIMYGFNANLVRLKEGVFTNSFEELFNQFQCQSGSIKSAPSKLVSVRLSGFNANLVRLKASRSMFHVAKDTCFNANLVRLKESTTYNARILPSKCFNANLVRLKEPPRVSVPTTYV